MNEQLITTTVEGKKALRIFETFETDVNLPKHKDKVTLATSNGSFTVLMSAQNPVGVWSNPPNQSGSSFFASAWGCIRKAWRRGQQKVEEYKAVPAVKIFEALMGSGKRLQNLTNRLDDYKKSIEYAKTMGQVALAESLTARLPIIQSEAILVVAGFVQYIDESQMIDFVLKCERGHDEERDREKERPHPVWSVGGVAAALSCWQLEGRILRLDI